MNPYRVAAHAIWQSPNCHFPLKKWKCLLGLTNSELSKILDKSASLMSQDTHRENLQTWKFLKYKKKLIIYALDLANDYEKNSQLISY